jgi:lactoylglutathione lyase
MRRAGRVTFVPAELFGVDVSAVYHVGYVVEDLDEAMTRFSEAMATRWVDHFVRVKYRSEHDTIVDVELHTSFSLDGPTHIELIQAAPGTIWEIGAGQQLHHVGMWTDDIRSDAQRLTSSGLPAVATGLNLVDESAAGYFSYHHNPHGGKVELVDIAMQQGMHDWIRT